MRIKALMHICPVLSHHIPFNDSVANESIYNIIQDIAPKVLESTYKCTWKRYEFICFELIKPTLTEDGVCFTFNALNSHEIYTDE